MKSLARHTALIGIASAFILYALYMWLWINPSLYLIRGYREFFTDAYFLHDFFSFPGYPAEYCARFIVQLYRFPLIASILISFILFSIYSACIYIVKQSKYRYCIAFVPVCILMLMHNDYRHTIRFDLNILMVCLILCLFISSFRYRKWQSVLLYPLLIAILLYLNGILASILFGCLSLIICLFKKEKATFLAEIACGIGIVFFIFHYLFHLSFQDLRQEITDISRIYIWPYFPFLLYISVLILPFLVYISRYIKVSENNPIPVIPTVALALFLILSVTLDCNEKRGLSVQHYALNADWEKALVYARLCESPDKDVVRYTNQALYFTGKLPDDLFLYNQSLGSNGLLSTDISNYSDIVPNQDVFLHLGAISLSIIWGTEATNVYGANPYVLKNLVKAYLSGGYIIEANKILYQLERIPFNGNWTKHYRKFVNDTTLINQDTELRTYRQSQAPLAVVSTQNVLMNLYLLMKDSKSNRMAYDYLLTASLLDHKIEYFASYLTGLKDYGYTNIPKLYFEGLVYNSLYAPQSPVNIRDFTFDTNIMYRFDAFRQDLKAALHDPENISTILKDKYADTYWYYLLFQSRLPNEEKNNILNHLIS